MKSMFQFSTFHLGKNGNRFKESLELDKNGNRFKECRDYSLKSGQK